MTLLWLLWSPPPTFGDLQRLATHEELLEVSGQFSALVLFLGHGNKGQIADINSTFAKVDGVVERLHSRYGQDRWAAVFGGDPYDSDRPDIAHILKYLKEVHSVTIFAIQSDIVIDWGGVDGYIDYVRYIPTVKVPIANGNGENKTTVHWGGFIDGAPAGPTGIYLGRDFIERPNPILKEVVVVGGGPIALDEVKFAYQNGVHIEYIRTPTRFPKVNGPFGSVDKWFQSLREDDPLVHRCNDLLKNR